MGFSDYCENSDKYNRKLKKCRVCGSKARLSYRSHMGKHWLDDKVWFKAYCTGCDAETPEYEDSVFGFTYAIECWNDVDCWTDGDIIVHEGTIKREKLIKKLRAENKRLKKGGHSK